MKNVLAEFEVNRVIRYSEEIKDENLKIKSELRSGHFFGFSSQVLSFFFSYSSQMPVSARSKQTLWWHILDMLNLNMSFFAVIGFVYSIVFDCCIRHKIFVKCQGFFR